ncbi:Fanconi anemia group C protein isoform X3 [Coturnix japonica]|uniref:Fanconi anemia group C protein isoform X3 n=1 Tax=Coturnix japonica TaxID=93934 RepID=UPI0007780A95|nr:Fanconi anemia group C protein isoform X3 [Coturnix japonica]
MAWLEGPRMRFEGVHRGMAQDTTVPKLNFRFWLDKAIEWGQATTSESQKDVCLHLPQLLEFLHQTYEMLKRMNSIVAIQQFPLIGQLLGRLCWNPFVIGYDESQKTLMWCLCCLYSSEPQNPVELKANSWIRSLLCHLLSSSKWERIEAETSTFISALGYTSADYYGHLVENIISSLVTELRGNQFNELNIQGKISVSRVNAMSLFCLPFVTLPDLTPLLETLLVYHGGASKEILSSEFLEAVNDAFLKKKISLSESAIFSLWHRHLPSLETATLSLLDQLVSLQINNLEKVACVIKDSLLHKFPLKAYFPHHHQPLVIALLRRPFELPSTQWLQHLKHISDTLKSIVEDTDISSFADLYEIWFLVACFGEWLDIAVDQLMKAPVAPDALLWLLSFYYCPQNESQQRTQTMVESQAVYSHLMMLYNHPVLSFGDLQAPVNNVADTEQCHTQCLITHLLTNFLFFSSGGHMIAQEFISYITETTDMRKEVCSLLVRTAYRIKHNGGENQRTVKLLNELLQKLAVEV